MGIELARAFVTVRGDASMLARDINTAKPGVERSIGGLVQSIGGLRGAFMGLAGVGTALGAISKAAKFEQTTIAFETMIGSATETKSTLAALTEFAAKTPFEMPEVEQAARGLIQFGERGDELIKTLTILGNAAAGTSTDFGMIALIFNQVRGVGKLLTQDFRQLSTRGVLSLQDIAKHYKVTTEAAQAMLSDGRISFNDFKKILAELSAEGGRFYQMTEKQSESLAGRWSTLKDEIGITARTLGQVLMPAAKDFVEFSINAASATREWVKENKYLVEALVKAAEALLIIKGLSMGGKIILPRLGVGGGGGGKVAEGIGEGIAGGYIGNKLAGAGARGVASVGEKAVENAAMGAGTYGARTAVTGMVGGGITGGMGVMGTLAGIGVVGVGLGALTYELYDLWKSMRMLEDETKRSADLDKEIAKSVKASRAAASSTGGFTMANLISAGSRGGGGYSAEGSKTITNLRKELTLLREEASLAAKFLGAPISPQAHADIWEYTHELQLNRQELMEIMKVRIEIDRQKTANWIKDYTLDTKALVEEWDNVTKAVEAFKKANPQATKKDIAAVQGEAINRDFKEIANSTEEVEFRVKSLLADYDEVGSKVADWAHEQKKAGRIVLEVEENRHRRAVAQEESLKKQEKLRDDTRESAKRRAEELETPQEKYLREVKKIKEEMLATDKETGEAVLKPEMAKKALAKARKDRGEALSKDFDYSSTGALDYGKKIQDMILKKGSEVVQEKQLGQLTQIEKDLQMMIDIDKKKPGGLLK